MTGQHKPSQARTAAARLARGTVDGVARRLPPPREEALHRLAGAARTLVTGRAGRDGDSARASEPLPTPPEPPRLAQPEPAPDLGTWPEPPVTAGKGGRVQDGAQGRPERLDADLLEQLNEEYRSKRIVTSAPSYTAAALSDAAKRRVRWVHDIVDLRGKRVLEIGCGSGFETWYAAHALDADAYGVDIVEWTPWKDLADDRTHFVRADMAAERPFERDSFDRVMSFTVWEHVVHPYRMLEETYRVLRPGGLAWIRANLYRGPKASHRYRDIYLPWPHLLFSDDVIAEWDRRHGRVTPGAAWVNRLTWAQYEEYFDRIGFQVLRRSFTQSPFDEDFYRRFEEVLSRYPRWDLITDYFLVVLRKPLPGEVPPRRRS